MKVVTLNVNGIRSSASKGVVEWLHNLDADIVCLQEIRASSDILYSIVSTLNTHISCNVAKKPGYSGVACLTKVKPLKVDFIELDYLDDEGRFLVLHFQNFCVINCYMPSGSSSVLRQQAKSELQDRFFQWLQDFKKYNKSLLICGDFNIAHTIFDIKNWKSNLLNSGFLASERAWLTALQSNLDLKDVYRHLSPKVPGYTWWSQRGGARGKDVGWRIDYQFATPNILSLARCALVYKEPLLSDHAALVVDYICNGELI